MDIYQHFRPEEKDFIDQVLGWADQVREQYAPKLTDFLNPREAEIIRMLIGKEGDVRVSFFGGERMLNENAPFYIRTIIHRMRRIMRLHSINYLIPPSLRRSIIGKCLVHSCRLV